MAEQVKVDIIVKALIEGFDQANKKFEEMAATQRKLALSIDNANTVMQKLAVAEKNLASNTDPAKQAQMQTEVLKAQVALDRELQTVEKLNVELKKLETESADAGTAQKKLADTAKQVEPATKKQSVTLGQLTTVVGQVGAAVGVFSAVFKQAFDLAAEGAQILLVEERLARLSVTIGTTSDSLMEKLRPAIGGMASDAEVAAQAGQLIELGLAKTEDDVVRLSTVVTKLGLDMSQVILTFANDSTMRLDALGLSVEDVTARTKKFTDAGIASGKAFDMAVLEALEARLEKVGDATDTTAGVFERAKSKIKNFSDELKKTMAEGLAPWVALVTGQYADAIRAIERENLAAAEAVGDYSVALTRSYEGQQDIITSAARSSDTLAEFVEKLKQARVHTFDSTTTAVWYEMERAIFEAEQATTQFNDSLTETFGRREAVRESIAETQAAEESAARQAEMNAEQQARHDEEQMGRLGVQIDLWSVVEERIKLTEAGANAFEDAMQDAVGIEQQRRLIDLALYWGNITEEEAAARHELIRLEEVQNRIYNTMMALTGGVQVYYDLAAAAGTYRQQLEQIEGLAPPTLPSSSGGGFSGGGGSAGTGPGAGDLIAPPGGGYVPPSPPPSPSPPGGQRYQGAVTSPTAGSNTYNIWLDGSLVASISGTLTAGVVAEQMGVNG